MIKCVGVYVVLADGRIPEPVVFQEKAQALYKTSKNRHPPAVPAATAAGKRLTNDEKWG